MGLGEHGHLGFVVFLVSREHIPEPGLVTVHQLQEEEMIVQEVKLRQQAVACQLVQVSNLV